MALIFAAPIVAFAFLDVMYFEETIWQAGFSLGFAALYAMLYQLLKRAHSVELIAQSYLSLTLVFLALIPLFCCLISGVWWVGVLRVH